MTGKESVGVNGNIKSVIAIASVLSALLGAAIALLVFAVPIYTQISSLRSDFDNAVSPWNSADAGAWRESVTLHKDDEDVHMKLDTKEQRFVTRVEWDLYVKTQSQISSQLLLTMGELKGRLPK